MEPIEKLGGGGSGTAIVVSGGGSASSGAGGKGTSYSGGTGGGGSCVYYSSSSKDGADSGEQSGKQGGSGNSHAGSGTAANYAGAGGAGNPGGYNEFGKHTQEGRAPDGTGGLLIIYTNKLDSTGKITSNGSDGGYVTSDGSYASGGASGGGSINIFYESLIHVSTCKAKGGKGKYGSAKNNNEYSGNGGDGGVVIGDISSKTFKQRTIEGESLLKIMEDPTITTGQYPVIVKGQDIEEKYNLDVTSHEGNLVLSSDKTYGTAEDDVAWENGDATNMVVLKVNGNLTIEENVTVTACKSKNGYGGPKGMMLYCTGTLTNKGDISMTERGARAEGQNVYLWKNADGSYEYVPAEGSTGGDRTSEAEQLGVKEGINGANGTDRKTRWRRIWNSSKN